jgi:type II secretory pathway pseudopilin PulG
MKKRSGQSLVEMVIAIAVVLVVIVSLVTVTTISIRNATFSRNQALATKYAQETIEKIREYRAKVDWNTFGANCQNPPGLPPVPSPFSRTINCLESRDSIEIKVTVSWTDAKGTHKSELTTLLSKWK